MNNKQTPIDKRPMTKKPDVTSTDDANIDKRHDNKDDRHDNTDGVIAAPSSKFSPSVKTRWQLRYDIIMLIIITIDLIIISIDLVLMSQFAQQLASWFGVSDLIEYYAQHWHSPLQVLGGAFTIFLIFELIVRWGLAIVEKRYMRWFFFPIIHWYEVLGCFPQLRALRLLRVIVIGHKLYKMGHQVLPQSWIDSGKFYYELMFEEITDRVILTATSNLRTQMSNEGAKQHLIEQTLIKNRPKIEAMLTSVLTQELAPKLEHMADSQLINELSIHVGASVENALANTPELRRYLRMIPIAGKLIENELHTVGQQIGEGLVIALTERLTEGATIDLLIQALMNNISNVNLRNPELESLVLGIIDDGLTAFEAQVKVQQWKHHEYLKDVLD